MENINFKVIAELKPDLPTQEKQLAKDNIKILQEKLSIKKIDDVTYCASNEDNTEFGVISTFFYQLKKMKQNFIHLEYYDFLDNEKEIAV